jgi:hypothetical protein
VIAAYLDELDRSKMPGYVAPNLDGEDLDIYDLPATRIPGNGGLTAAGVNGEADKMRLRPTGTAH